MSLVNKLSTLLLAAGVSFSAALMAQAPEQEGQRPRAREIGLVVGIFEPGENNAITDVGEVKVGHTTVIRGDDIRTGVTAVIPAEGNLYAVQP